MDRAEALDVLAARPDRAGIFLDFDGTLSEIAPTPDVAVAVEGASETLARLASRFALVGVVTGRRAAEASRLLGSPRGVRVFGLYGAEANTADPSSSGSVGLDAAVTSAVAKVPGVLVESKGPNVAVHYRGSPDPEEARARILDALRPLASERRMDLLEGKMVVELAPAGSPSKGDVVRREGANLEAVMYAGDDAADLDAFAALEDLAANGTHCVKVAVRTSETPAGLIAAADIAIGSPRELVRLLASLSG